MATGSVFNTIKDPAGTAVPSVTVTARLQPGVGFRADGTEIAALVATTSDTDGYWTLSLEINTSVLPAGSWWEITEAIPVASGGTRIWAVNAASGSHSLYASLVTPSEASGLSNYITQSAADARYAPLGAAITGSESGFIKVGDYGAVGDGSTDDTAAIQAALAAANAVGAICKFEGLPYKCASYWDYSAFANVHCLGTNGKGAARGTRIIFTGTYNSRSVTISTTAASQTVTSSNASFTAADVGSSIRIGGAGFNASQEFNTVISAVTNSTTATVANAVPRTVTSQTGCKMGAGHIRFASGTSANGCTWKQMRFEVSSTAFYGDIFNFYAAAGAAPGYLIHEDCTIGIAPGSTASTFNYNNSINWHKSILCTAYRIHFNGGMIHSIRGLGNTNTVDDCRFEALNGDSHILNCNQAFRCLNSNVFATASTSSSLFDCDIAQPAATATFIANQVADGLAGGGGDGLSGIRFHGDHLNVIGGLYEDADYGLTLIGSATLTASLQGVQLGANGNSIRFLTTPVGASQKVQAVTADTVTINASSPFLNPTNCVAYHARGNPNGTDSVVAAVNAGVVTDAFAEYQPVSGQMVLDTSNSRIYFRVGSTWKSAALT